MFQLERLAPIHEIETIDEARIGLLGLPGIDHYIPDPMVPVVDFDRQADEMIDDLESQVQAANCIVRINHLMGNGDENDKFKHDPRLQPYETALHFSDDIAKRAEQFGVIGRYLCFKYHEARAKLLGSTDEVEDLKREFALRAADFNNFYLYTLDDLFGELEINFHDNLNGRIDNSLDLLIENVSGEYSSGRVDAAEDLQKQVGQVVDENGLDDILGFLSKYRGTPMLRQALQTLYERRVNEVMYTRGFLELLWFTIHYGMTMGMDGDTFLEINGYPEEEDFRSRLERIVTDDNYTKKTWQLLKQETGLLGVRAMRRRETLDYWDILQARAEKWNFPDFPKEKEEKTMDREVFRQVIDQMRTMFPIAFRSIPTIFLSSRTAVGRDTMFQYYNSKAQPVRVIYLNYRDNLARQHQIAGHETTHGLIFELLLMAQKANKLPKNFNGMPVSKQEIVTQLTEDGLAHSQEYQQIKVMFDNAREGLSQKISDWPRPFKWMSSALLGKLLGAAESKMVEISQNNAVLNNVGEAMERKNDAVSAVATLSLRYKMEESWRDGRRGWYLTDSELNNLNEHIKAEIAEWYRKGVPIQVPFGNVHSHLSICEPDDKLRYITEMIAQSPAKVQQKAEKKLRILTIEEAFIRRFGFDWIKNKDARAVLYHLIIHMVSEDNVAEYADFVSKCSAKDSFALLAQMGITEDLV